MDSYSVAASPNFGVIRRSNFDISGSNSEFGQGLQSPFLSQYDKKDSVVDRVSTGYQSSWLEKGSSYAGELPISHGCSLTQTVFNGDWGNIVSV